MKTTLKLTAVFEEAEEGGYMAFVEELPGVNSQGENLEESKSKFDGSFGIGNGYTAYVE